MHGVFTLVQSLDDALDGDADRRGPLGIAPARAVGTGFPADARATFIDSSSLGVLIGAHRRLKQRHGSLVVVCDNEAIVKTFKITGLDGVFTLVRVAR